MSGPHDRLVRETFARPPAAAWLLEHALAPLRLAAPTPLPDAALLQGRERRADLAFDLAEHHLRVFIEHQSTQRPDMALRCLDHLVIAAQAARNEEQDAEVPYIHVLVLFQGPGRWAAPTSLADPRPDLPDGMAALSVAPAYSVCHLEDLPLADAPADARIALRLLVRTANGTPNSSPWALTLQDVEDLQRVRDKLGSSAVLTVISYLTTISDTPPPEDLMAQLQHQHPELAEDFVSYAEQLRREGEARIAKQHAEQLERQKERLTRAHEARLQTEREKAERAEREREQATRAQRDLLLQLATQQLGDPTPEQRERVAQLSAQGVHAAMTRIFTAKSWDALLG